MAARGWAAASLKLTIDPEPYLSLPPRYRWLGKTELWISEISLGGHGGSELLQVRMHLEDCGQSVELRDAVPEDLAAADTIWVLNSLLGIMPVRSVDEVELPDLAAEEASRLREELFGQKVGRL